jgi:transposase
MTSGGMEPSMAAEGATTAPVVETYVKHILTPQLKQGQVVVMGNLDAHKPKRISSLIEERGCELLYLPPYSPDYNPIEEAFSKIKALVRRVGARSREALLEAIGEALSAVSVHTTLRASLSTQVTVRWVSYCETCRDTHRRS